MNKLVFSATFFKKLDNAVVYYRKINPNLGKRFYENLIADLERIKKNPHLFGYLALAKSKTIRRLNQKKFPFVILFEVEGNEITILNLHNIYQNPNLLLKF
jgi:mRNA-degrading endonuclease RelE of RelBE toxin-antitoxin system